MKSYYATVDTPIGCLMLVRSDGMLVRVGLPKPERRELMAGAVERADGFGDLARRLRLYFQGERVEFSDVPVKFEGLGAFEERALRETMRVPYGQLTTYSALAGAVGSPGAARAVGNAMSRNPMPIIVPCHRVVRSDGSIGGYSAGTLVKRRLLALEGIAI